MKTAFYFLVEISERELALTWIGGPLKPSKKPGHVWLTLPGGDPVLELPKHYVQPSTQEETAKRLLADRLALKAPMN